MQKVWADSGYVGKINTKTIFKIFFFQRLALPKYRQSLKHPTVFGRIDQNLDEWIRFWEN